MLVKQRRLTKAAEFSAVFKRGYRITNKTLQFFVLVDNQFIETKIGFVVNRKVGNAVTRNLIKRRLRALAKENLLGTKKQAIIIRALPNAAEITFRELEQHFIDLVKKIK